MFSSRVRRSRNFWDVLGIDTSKSRRLEIKVSQELEHNGVTL